MSDETPDPLAELQKRYVDCLAVNREQVDRLSRAAVEIEHLRMNLERVEDQHIVDLAQKAAMTSDLQAAQTKVATLEERCKLLESHIPARLMVPGASK